MTKRDKGGDRRSENFQTSTDLTNETPFQETLLGNIQMNLKLF